MTYAVIINGAIQVRALPTKSVAEKIAAANGGKAIIDPRCIQR